MQAGDEAAAKDVAAKHNSTPRDIIGFDSYEQPTGRWKFVLHCSSVEWCFESDWPVMQRSPAEQSVAPDCGGIG